MEKITGKVREGRKVGRKIGFPTLNLPYGGDLRGVFVGEVLLGGERRSAAVHLGPRPTFGDEEVVCEAFLIDWEGEVEVGTEVEIEVFEKIRDVMEFEDLEALAERISRDVEYVKNWYNSARK